MELPGVGGRAQRDELVEGGPVPRQLGSRHWPSLSAAPILVADTRPGPGQYVGRERPGTATAAAARTCRRRPDRRPLNTPEVAMVILYYQDPTYGSILV